MPYLTDAFLEWSLMSAEGNLMPAGPIPANSGHYPICVVDTLGGYKPLFVLSFLTSPQLIKRQNSSFSQLTKQLHPVSFVMVVSHQARSLLPLASPSKALNFTALPIYDALISPFKPLSKLFVIYIQLVPSFVLAAQC